MNRVVKQGLTSNKLELIYTVGLSGSSKSSWARKIQSDNMGKYKLISKDDLRLMIDQGEWSKQNEKEILQAEEVLIRQFLRNGHSVIVHNTHLHSKYEKFYRELGAEYGAKVVRNDSFLEVPLEECIKRDLKRVHSVGEAVIRKQYKDFLEKPKDIYPDTPGSPHCIIVDIDNTIAEMVSRGPYDWKKVGEDKPKEKVINVIKAYLEQNQQVELFIMSGRDSVCRPETELWLNAQGFDKYNYKLIMRKKNDSRKDSLIKRELFDNNIALFLNAGIMNV